MNNPNAPYQIPEPSDGFFEFPETVYPHSIAYRDEREMLDGMKTQAAIRQAIERPRVHYKLAPKDYVELLRLDNATGVWHILDQA